MSTKRFILAQLAICVVAILALEAAARIVFSFADDRSEKPGAYALSSELGWDRRPGYSGPEDCGAHRDFDESGLVATDAAKLRDKRDHRPRVVFLGDSNTFGYCLKTESTFVEAAQRLLPDWLMLNLGVSGYTSFQGYKTLLKYGEPLRPDLIVVSFNFNDRRYVAGPEMVDSDVAMERLAQTQGLRDLLKASHLFRLVSLVGGKLGLVGSGNPREVTVDKLFPRVSPENYRANLIKMVDWARQHQARVAFLLTGDNPNVVGSLGAGIRSYEAGDYKAAIDYLSYAEARPFSFAEPVAKKYLAKAYAARGQPDKAQQSLKIKPGFQTHGGRSLYLDTEYNQIMRQVALDYEVPLIDAKSVLDKVPRVFFDFAHFDDEGHQLVAELLYTKLPQVLAPQGVAGETVGTRFQSETSTHK